MPALIQETTRSIRKREQQRQTAKEALTELFLKGARDGTVVKRVEIAKITGGDVALRKEVLTDLEREGMYFEKFTWTSAVANYGDWKLATPERRFQKAGREVTKLGHTAHAMARMCQTAEPHLSKEDRAKSRAIVELLDTSATVLHEQAVAEVTEAVSKGQDATVMVAAILARPRFR